MAEKLDILIERVRKEGQLTRNSGTHSIKSIKEVISPALQNLVQNTELTYQSLNDSNELTKQQMFDAKQAALVARDQAAEAKKSKGKGEGIGKAAAGIGKGVGDAATGLGLGALLGGGALALMSFLDIDTKKIRKNVNELLSIQDDFGGAGEFFKKGGTFLLAMTGLGLGLAAFGVGQAAVAIGQFFSKDDFALQIKENVAQLLSINDLFSGNLDALAEGGTFFLTMTGLGLGLAAFAVGQAGSAIAGGMTGVLEYFTGGNWAETIVKNVETLLQVSTLVGGSMLKTLAAGGTFPLIMTGLGLGLAAFAIGEAASNVASAIGLFREGLFAQEILDNVKILLSIPNLPGVGGDTGGFLAVMGGLSAGLVAFAIGKAGNNVGDAVGKFTGNFADNIKRDVSTLLSIMEDPNIDTSKAGEFAKVMGQLGLGLGAFALAKGLDGLANITGAIGSFLSGEESTISQILKLTDKVADLELVSNALDNIRSALNEFGKIKIDVDGADLEALAKKLGSTIPLLEGLAKGGKVDQGVFSFDVDFGKGLLSPDLKLDEMVAQINKVNSILGFSPAQAPAAGAAVNAGSTEVAEGQRGGGGVVVGGDSVGNVSVDNSSVSSSTNVGGAAPAARSDAMGAYKK